MFDRATLWHLFQLCGRRGESVSLDTSVLQYVVQQDCFKCLPHYSLSASADGRECHLASRPNEDMAAARTPANHAQAAAQTAARVQQASALHKLLEDRACLREPV